jgi:hypothetical protein
VIGYRSTCGDSNADPLDRDPSFLIMLLKHGNEQETAVMSGEEMMRILTCIFFIRKDE